MTTDTDDFHFCNNVYNKYILSVITFLKQFPQSTQQTNKHIISMCKTKQNQK